MKDDLPATRFNLLLTIRTLLPSLNEQEQKVGQYVLEHPAEVIHLAVSEMAQRCGASDATVFRFSKKVGTEGYQNFKILLAQELASSTATPYATLGREDNLATAIQKVIAADVKALQDTLSVLDLSALESAVDVLLAARRVDIYGSGGAAVAALELQYKLMRVGVRAVVHTDSEMQVISATLLTSADAAIAISHSGESPDILRALEVAKEAGAKTIAITNHLASPIAKAVDINLSTAAQEALAHGYPLGARVAQVGLIDALHACMSVKRRDEAERNLKRIASALNHHPG
jgi:RpiR family transcriptional regulator, carbohydrate utilization regulator